jgi:transcription antitermination protein NusB
MRRRILREKVLQALYARELSGDPLDHVIKHILHDLLPHADAHEFAKQLVVETVHHCVEIDKVIRGKVANWAFKRIALLDRLILRMAICELLYFKDIPPKVTIDEAIELAKLFSTDGSAQFVNGVLDAILGDLMLTGKMGKVGRGLLWGEHKVRGQKAKAKKIL